MNISTQFILIEQKVNQRRMKTAKQLYIDLLLLPLSHEEKAKCLYNLGSINWEFIGNGIDARRYMIETIKWCDASPENHSNQQIQKYNAYACENMMILSLSYNEYKEWADRLRLLSPNEPILSGQFPVIKEATESGVSWFETMDMLANNYYSRSDPSLDRGLYGQAASIYHLILANRSNLRVSKSDWSHTLLEYGVLKLRLAMINRRTMEQTGGIEQGEYKFILEDVRTYINEYSVVNSLDSSLQSLSRDINRLLGS